MRENDANFSAWGPTSKSMVYLEYYFALLSYIPGNMNFHNLDIEKVFELTGSSQQGLTTQAVAEKLAEFGPNELEVKKKKPLWLLFVNQFKDFMILVLIAAAVVSGVVGDITDTIIILVIIVLNAIVGFV